MMTAASFRPFRFWLSLGLSCTLLSAAWAQQSDPFAALPSYDFGKDSTAISTIEKQVRDGGVAGYAAIEAKLLAAVAQPGATYACKKFVAETLRIIGSEACVAPMLKLLDDEKTADLARLALEGSPSKSVDAAMLKAVKSSSGKVQIGIIQSLAARHNAELAAILKDFLGSGNADLTRASLQALARVGGAKAVDVLKSAQVSAEFQPLRERALADSAFNAANAGDKAAAVAVFEQLFKSGTTIPGVIAGLNGLVDFKGNALPVIAGALKDQRAPVALAAAKASVRVKGAAVTKELAAALPSVSPAIQVAVLRALAERSDKSALAAVKTALASQDDAVKTEAILALEKVGDSSVVGELVALSTGDGDVAAAAQQTLGRLNASGVNEAMIKLLDDADAKKVRVAALTLKARADRAILPRLLKMAESDKAETRGTALDALDDFAGLDELPALVELLKKAAASGGDVGKTTKVVWDATKAVGKEDDRFAKLWADAGSSPDAVKAALLPLASQAGGDAALKVVTQTIASGSDALKEPASRTLFGWPNDRAINPLVDFIKKNDNSKNKILAARAVVRILNDKKTGLDTKKKIGVLNQIEPSLERPEDKKMIADAIAKFGGKSSKK